MSNIDKQALRADAVRAGGGKWIYIRTLSLSKAYITEETGATVINCTDGDVPAKCAGFLASANPATVLALLDELEAKGRRIEEEIGRANREHHRGFMMACRHLKEHSNVHYADAAEMEIAALRNRINELESAPPAPVSVPDEMAISDDMNLYQKSFAQGHNTCRAAMLQGAEPVTTANKLPLDYLQGHKDGLEWAARLAEANHPQTGDWLYDDPLDLAKAIRKGPDMPEADGNSPVIPDGYTKAADTGIPIESDGWVACSERMPNPSTGVIVAAPWQSAPGGYAMKWATNCPGHPDADTDGWIIPGASWRPTHWMPLPAAPKQEVK